MNSLTRLASIGALLAMCLAASPAVAETTTEQRLTMVTRSAELGRRYGELTTEIQQLERDRAVAERALLEYRSTLTAGVF